MSLKFHWMLPKGGEVAADGRQTAREATRYRVESVRVDSPSARPDVEGWTLFARAAEDAGIESVLISFSRYEPDPFMVACALGAETERLKFIVAYRSGLAQPTTFVQQVNTLACLTGGRVAVNIVAGSSAAEQRGYGDFLKHDERYARAEEFLTICNAFWKGGGEVNFDGRHYKVERGKLHTPFAAPDRAAPEVYVSGHSEQAVRLACEQGTCWLRVIDTPQRLAPLVASARTRGVGVCLRLALICRPTHEEAVGVALSLLPDDARECTTRLKDDSQMYREGAAVVATDHWLGPNLWAGLVPHYGPVWTTLVGTPRELADAFLEYGRLGVTEFIISGWPEREAARDFGREVIPLVREAEKAESL